MSNENVIIEKIEELRVSLLSQKKVLSFVECKRYTGFSSSHLYKLTSKGKIPHFKPEGKFIYFDRIEVENWLLRNPIKTDNVLEHQALQHVANNQKGGKK